MGGSCPRIAQTDGRAQRSGHSMRAGAVKHGQEANRVHFCSSLIECKNDLLVTQRQILVASIESLSGGDGTRQPNSSNTADREAPRPASLHN